MADSLQSSDSGRQSHDMTYPVVTVDDAYAACDPDEPLASGDPRWVDLNPARGGFDLARIVARRIARTGAGAFCKQLVTGHRGSGKSTEIIRLSAHLRDQGFFAVYFDAFAVLDPQDIEYVDVLLGIAQTVYDELRATEVTLSEPLLQSLEAWFDETFITAEDKVDIEASVKSELGVEAKIPALLRVFTALTGQLKAGGSRRHEVRQKLERELRVFLLRLNELLDDVQVQLVRADWHGLVVLVDNLEKLPYQTRPDGSTNHVALFVHHAEQLKTPRCHIVYTVPVSLLFNVNLGSEYDAINLIPMVKISDQKGTPHEPGLAALLDVLERRMDVSRVFAPDADTRRLAAMSGGAVRDLLRMVRFACDEAEEQISAAHVQRALRALVREFEYLVQDDDVEHLLEIARRRDVAGDELSGRLLYNRLVLEYSNEDTWYDVHPAVRAGRRLRDRLSGG